MTWILNNITWLAPVLLVLILVWILIDLINNPKDT